MKKAINKDNAIRFILVMALSLVPVTLYLASKIHCYNP